MDGKNIKSLRAKYGKSMNINDKVEARVRAYPQWSRAEQVRMDDIVEDVLRYMRSGSGTPWVRRFVDSWVMKDPAVAAAMGR